MASINLLLDEKKCDCLKSTVEHIQAKMCQFLDVSLDRKDQYTSKEEDKISDADDVELVIDYEKDSDDDEMEVD